MIAGDGWSPVFCLKGSAKEVGEGAGVAGCGADHVVDAFDAFLYRAAWNGRVS